MKCYKPFKFKEENKMSMLNINPVILDYLKHKDATKLIKTIADNLEKTGNYDASKRLQKLILEV